MNDKYVLVIYSYTDKSYKRQIGEPTENRTKLCKAMLGLDMRIDDTKFYSIIEPIRITDET